MASQGKTNKKPPSPTPSSSSDDAVSSNVPLFGFGPPQPITNTPPQASLSLSLEPTSPHEPDTNTNGPESNNDGRGVREDDDDSDSAASSHPPLYSPEPSASPLRPLVVDHPLSLGLSASSLAPLPFGKLGTVKSLVLPPTGPYFKLAGEDEVVQLMLNDSNLRR